MATEQELAQAEEQARRIQAQQIPRRRFGSRITAKTQQQVQAQQRQASDVLSEVQKQRQQIEQLKSQTQQQQQSQSRESLKQDALNYLLARGKANDSYNALSPSERAEVNDQASSLKKTRGIIQANQVVADIQKQLGPDAFLGKDVKDAIIKEALANGGKVTFVISQSPNQSYQGPVQQGYSEIKFRETGKSIKLTQGPVQQGKSQLVFRELNKNVPISEENRYFKVVNSPESFHKNYVQPVQNDGKTHGALIDNFYKNVESARLKFQKNQNPVNNVFRSIVNLPIGSKTLGQRSTQSIDFITGVFDIAEKGNYNRPKTRIENIIDYDARVVSEGLFFGATGIVTLPLLALSGLNRVYNAESPNEFLTGIGETAFAGLGLVAEAKGFLDKPVAVKVEPKPDTKFTSEVAQISLLEGEKNIDVGAFILKGYTPKQEAFIVTRSDLMLRNIIGLGTPERNLAKVSMEELQLMFPQGKRILLNDELFSVSAIEPALIKNGEFVGSLRGKKGVGLITINGKGDLLTNQKVTLSRIQGEMSANILDSIKKTGLDKINRASLEDIESLLSLKKGEYGFKTKKGYDYTFEAKRDIPLIKKALKNENIDVSIGNVKVSDVFKIKDNLFDIVPYGKRTRTGSITAIRESKAKVTFEDEFGLKEIEKFKETLGVVDVTYPRFNRPNKITRIEGKGTRYLFELPVESEPVNIQKPVPKQKTTSKTSQILADLQGASAISVSKNLPKSVSINKVLNDITTETQRIANLPKYVGGGGLGKSLFAGQGLYEQSEIYGAIPRSSNKQKLEPLSIDLARTETRYNLKEISLLRPLSREIVKEQTRDILRTEPKEVARETTRLDTLMRSLLRSVQRSTTRTATPSYPSSPPRRPTREPPIIKIDFPKPKKYDLGKDVFGYKTFIVRQGKKYYFEGLRPKGKALSFGVEETLKSLRATFGIEKTSSKVTGTDTGYKPSSKVFREYKVRRGKAIFTEDLFIQKRNKRLLTGLERYAIQSARRSSSSKRRR